MTGEDIRMTAEELQKLYHESISFKLYVDKVCRSSGVSKGRDAKREYRQNYGC